MSLPSCAWPQSLKPRNPQRALSGWPTAADPYAQPSAYAYPDMEQVLLHLSPK